jgi:hypothetical protein
MPRCEDNIKMDQKEMLCEGVVLMHLAENRVLKLSLDYPCEATDI